MCRKLKVSHNKILRRLPCVSRCASARTLFVNLLQDNVDVLIRNQCFSLKLWIEGSHNRVIRCIFDSYSLKVSNQFVKSRHIIESSRTLCWSFSSLVLNDEYDLSFITYVNQNKWFLFVFCFENNLHLC